MLNKTLIYITLGLFTMMIVPVHTFSQNSTTVNGSGLLFSEGVLQPYHNRITEVFHEDVPGELAKLSRSCVNEILKNDDAGPSEKTATEFILPLNLIDGLNDPGFLSITAYVDHDTLYPDHLLDYNCGDLTYDLDNGYSHSGTDFFLWPFPWKKMDDQEVEVVAAAPGIIIFKQDGNYDRNCEANNDPWNAIAIRHSDGFITWYGHLKANSLTIKEAGNYVEEGEYLGIVGSSGSSLAPHLHFEVYDSLYNLIDPFAGPCNPETGGSMWKEQLPYKEPYVNKISTNSKVPVFPDCPEDEIPNESDQFHMGDTIFLLSYFSNMQTDDEVQVRIRRPDQSLWQEWSWTCPWEFYTSSYLYFFIILKNEQEGNWMYELTYKNKSYQHTFNVTESQGIKDNESMEMLEIYPNPAENRLYVKHGFITENAELTVFNAIGMQVMKIPVKKYNDLSEIDVSVLERGIYYISIQNNDYRFSEKFILY